MPGFGEILRSEREARNVTIERVAGETGIHLDYLEALERNEIHGLPGRAFGKLYIRAYARMLGFDPQPLIDAYDRELQRARPASTESAGPGPVPGRPVNSMIASWRQARIAERTRTTDDGAPFEAADDENSVDEAEESAMTGEYGADGADDSVAAEELAADEAEDTAEAGEYPTDEDDETAVAMESAGAEANGSPLPDQAAVANGVVAADDDVENPPDVTADEQSRVAVEEQRRVAADEQSSSLAAEEQSRVAADEQSRIAVDGHGSLDAADQGSVAVAPLSALDDDSAPVARNEAADAVDAVLVPSAALASDALSTPRTRSRAPAVAIVLALGLLVGLSAIVLRSFGGKRSGDPAPPVSVPAGAVGSSSPPVPSHEAPVLDPPAVKPRKPAGTPPVSPVEPPQQARPAQAVPEAPKSQTILSVTESGLGRRIVDHQVEGQDERFPVGTVVWFQTRALGGGPGDAIRHVWIHDGRAVQSIRLRLGGSDWRTQSSKTLRHVGPWAVEARDKDGRVLARADFVCESDR